MAHCCLNFFVSRYRQDEREYRHTHLDCLMGKPATERTFLVGLIDIFLSSAEACDVVCLTSIAGPDLLI